MKFIKIIIVIICLMPLIILHIVLTHHALFYKIPTLQSLGFTEFGAYKYREGRSCYAISRDKGRTDVYEFKIRRDGKVYKPIYTNSTWRECYKQLDELEQKRVKIWYNIEYEDYIFNRKESDIADFEIYQLSADDKIIISYQKSLNIIKRKKISSLFVMIVMYIFDIVLCWRISKKIKERSYEEEVNYDYSRYGRYDRL